MPDHLYKRGRIYYCWYYAGTPPRLIRESTHCTDREAARLKLKELERKANAPIGSAAHEAGHTIGEELALFLAQGGHDVSNGTKHMREIKAGHLGRILGAHDMNRISQPDVSGYIDARLAEGAARSTVSKELSTLRACLAFAVERGERARDALNPIPRFKAKYIPRTRHLTPEEFQKLSAASVRIRRKDGKPIGREQVLIDWRTRWLMLAAYTGQRDSELTAICWEHIDQDWKGLRIPGTKTAGSWRWIPLHPALRRELQKTERGTGPIVGPWPNVRRDLANACKRAGIARVTSNDFRRTFASWMKQAGIDSKAVASLLGHTSSRMVDLVYGHLNDESKVRAIAALPDCATGVKGSRRSAALAAPSGKSQKAQKARREQRKVVPRGGIEPPTRGFSIPVAADPKGPETPRNSQPLQGDSTSGVKPVGKGSRSGRKGRAS